MTIITRFLKIRSSGKDTEVPIQIFLPEQKGNSWFCRWEIGWPNRKRANLAGGFDAIQALVHALQTVGTEIYNSEEHASGNLTWEEPGRGYGFPVPGNIRDLLIGDDAKYL